MDLDGTSDEAPLLRGGLARRASAVCYAVDMCVCVYIIGKHTDSFPVRVGLWSSSVAVVVIIFSSMCRRSTTPTELLGARRNSTLTSCSAPLLSSPRHSAAAWCPGRPVSRTAGASPLQGSLPRIAAVLAGENSLPCTADAECGPERVAFSPMDCRLHHPGLTPDNDRTPRRSSGGRGTAHQTHKRPGNARAGNSRRCSCHITDR